MPRVWLQVTEISPNTPGCGFWPSLSLEDFQAFKGVVHVLTTKHVTWYPKFGCALLAVPSPHGGTPGVGISVGLDQLSLHLVALDSWAFHIHRCAFVLLKGSKAVRLCMPQYM